MATYDFNADMERRRAIVRIQFPEQSASPPPPKERNRESEPTRPPAKRKMALSKAPASSTAKTNGDIRPQVIELSSPELTPVTPNFPKRSRGDVSDTTMSDIGSPPQIPTEDGVRQPPKWYLSIKKDNFFLKQVRQKTKDAQKVTKLESLKTAIKDCQQPPLGKTMAGLFNNLRKLLHDTEFLEVNQFMLKALRMLDNKSGLPRIFDPDFSGGVVYPWDIKADAKQLYNRWWMEIFDIDILRGIKRAVTKKKEDKRNADKIDPTFKKRLFANHYGQGNLVNGQWWPTQLCTLRDGAHGSAQGGIYGEKGRGVFSIVLSGGHTYYDVDNGDTIWYSGTDGKDEKPTENTQRLIESSEMPENDKEPVRVIRSSNLNKENQYRPDRGFRYDGLYDVVEYELVDKSKAIHKFRLVRRTEQDPIRWQGVEIRPTEQEKAAYQKLLDDGKIPT